MTRSSPWKVGHSPNQGNFSERLYEEKTERLTPLSEPIF